MALVGVVLLALGLLRVADPGLDSSMDPEDPGRSPFIIIGLILLVFGGLGGYAAYLISRE
jgi:hypothetical protein